mmetsp:Transcript_25287/g.59649  ORF Transcript_25287/g.59649 Transcript_25287/m.59649 type:complete len:205 (+) Transcript_25287:1127-1741(+)
MMAGGNAFFSASEFRDAAEAYEEFLALVEESKSTHMLAAQQLRELRHMVVAVRLNLAVCHLKSGSLREAIDCCDQVLEAPGNDGIKAKAHTRRGRAHMAMERWAQARDDFMAALRANPESSEARKVLMAMVRRQNATMGGNTSMYPSAVANGAAWGGGDGPRVALPTEAELDNLLFPSWDPSGSSGPINFSSSSVDSEGPLYSM